MPAGHKKTQRSFGPIGRTHVVCLPVCLKGRFFMANFREEVLIKGVHTISF